LVARRIEERREATAETYALKVPQYDPNTARSVSEQEFMDMFREEAGALLALPKHPNLARFVTFDQEARPKPILVMELIRGQSLERRVRSRSLSLGQAVDTLTGILLGLEAMHAVGVAHLDVKPSNVILRDDGTPVLVDFGLSGRHLRPGCGTLEYCAPEVLGVVPEDCIPNPSAADMYAFGCLAFEVLCGEILFDADDELTLISEHVSHDGFPKRLALLAQRSDFQELAILLSSCLRRDPRLRPSALQARSVLFECMTKLGGREWPLLGEQLPHSISAE
jgi:serine/threonine protein kinase